jgi:hypothetical protein
MRRSRLLLAALTSVAGALLVVPVLRGPGGGHATAASPSGPQPVEVIRALLGPQDVESAVEVRSHSGTVSCGRLIRKDGSVVPFASNGKVVVLPEQYRALRANGMHMLTQFADSLAPCFAAAP